MTAHILIAEDDEMQGTALRAVMEHFGHIAETVTDGFEAVRRSRASRFDVALLDDQMPEISGLATAQLLHDILGEEACPRLIAVTAQAGVLGEREKQSGIRSFDAIVSKSDGLAALLDAIDGELQLVVKSRGAPVGKTRLQAGRPTQVVAPAEPTLSTRQHPLEISHRRDGQVHVISLAAFRVAAGPEWRRLGLSAMMKAESIIKRRLRFDDVVARSGDHSFVLWFDSSNEAGTESVVQGAVREIRLRFLMEFGEELALNASVTRRMSMI